MQNPFARHCRGAVSRPSERERERFSCATVRERRVDLGCTLCSMPARALSLQVSQCFSRSRSNFSVPDRISTSREAEHTDFISCLIVLHDELVPVQYMLVEVPASFHEVGERLFPRRPSNFSAHQAMALSSTFAPQLRNGEIVPGLNHVPTPGW